MRAKCHALFNRAYLATLFFVFVFLPIISVASGGSGNYDMPPVFAVVQSPTRTPETEQGLSFIKLNLVFIGNDINLKSLSIKAPTDSKEMEITLKVPPEFSKTPIGSGDLVSVVVHHREGNNPTKGIVKSTSYTLKGVIKAP